MFRVITANTNGIRSAAKKGFFDWLKAQDADVVCIQETKAQRDQLDDAQFHPQGYHCYYFDAEKRVQRHSVVCKTKTGSDYDRFGLDISRYRRPLFTG